MVEIQLKPGAEAPGTNKCPDCTHQFVEGKCVNKNCVRNRDKF